MQRKGLGLLLGALFLSSNLVSGGERAVPPRQPKVAVLNFEDGSLERWWRWDWRVGQGVADMLVTSLVRTKKFQVVERKQLGKVLAEQGLQQTAFVNPATAVKVGKLMGATHVILGKVTEFSLEVSEINLPLVGRVVISKAHCAIDGRLVEVETGVIVAAEKGEGSEVRKRLRLNISELEGTEFGSERFERTILGKAVRRACDNLAKKFGQAVGNPDLTKIVGKVVYVDEETEQLLINLGGRFGVKVGDVFEVYREGEVIKDPDTGEVLTVITRTLGRIKVVGVEEKVATCEVVVGELSRMAIRTLDDGTKEYPLVRLKERAPEPEKKQ